MAFSFALLIGLSFFGFSRAILRYPNSSSILAIGQDSFVEWDEEESSKCWQISLLPAQGDSQFVFANSLCGKSRLDLRIPFYSDNGEKLRAGRYRFQLQYEKSSAFYQTELFQIRESTTNSVIPQVGSPCKMVNGESWNAVCEGNWTGNTFSIHQIEIDLERCSGGSISDTIANIRVKTIIGGQFVSYSNQINLAKESESIMNDDLGVYFAGISASDSHIDFNVTILMEQTRINVDRLQFGKQDYEVCQLPNQVLCSNEKKICYPSQLRLYISTYWITLAVVVFVLILIAVLTFFFVRKKMNAVELQLAETVARRDFSRTPSHDSLISHDDCK
eukprot:TRINITY_DN3408_c0_g1_i1.p1 TRINITY_DN3408_c0_g1~~TRINITY_DN3408_c0_g1_i1.p1  ORF type:complete len:333 (+),score=57.77 TRINITY_DN3408_c0_g1_i1:108-1106(+)